MKTQNIQTYIYWVWPKMWEEPTFTLGNAHDYVIIKATSPRAARRKFVQKHPCWKGQEAQIVCEEKWPI